MGRDINAFIEWKVEGDEVVSKHTVCFAQIHFFWRRYYNLFELMYDKMLENDDRYQPDDLSPEALERAMIPGDAISWLLVEELEELQNEILVDQVGADPHPQLSAIIAMMKQLKDQECESRFVFWFDG